MRKMFRWWLTAAAIFSAAALVGGPWLAIRPHLLVPINGAVLAGVCGALHKEGMSGKLLATGLLPHGVPELSALFLACGAGIAGAAPGEKFALFRRVVVTLLAVAAVLETWVTPEVMRFVEF